MADNIEIDALATTCLLDGNTLQSVTDGGTNNGYYPVPGDYTYDANGNMNSKPRQVTCI